MMLMLLCAVVSTTWAEEVAYKTLTFSADNSDKASGYSNSWKTTIDGFEWQMTNCNNNSFNNNWAYIRIGSKSNAMTSNITTNTIMDKAITKVVVTVDKTANSDGTKLEVASDAEFTDIKETVTVSLAKGENTYAIEAPAANSYYRLTFSQKKGANGDTQISKVVYYAENDDTPVVTVPVPTFDPASGAEVKVGDQITISTTATGDGAGIIYSTDGISVDGQTEAFDMVYEQTATVTITESMVKDGKVSIHAESFVGNDYSDEVEAVYTIKEEEEPAPGESTVYTLVTDASTLAAGDKIIFVGVNGEDTYAMGASNSGKTNRVGVKVTKNADGTIETADGVVVITLEGSANGWNFKVGEEGYLNNNSTSTKSQMNTVQTISAQSTATIAISGDESPATVTFGAATNVERNKLRFNYNGGSTLFNIYATGQKDIYIYRETTQTADEVSVIINRHLYTTYSNGEKALDLSQLPEGLTAYKVTELTKDYTVIEEISEPVPANTGLLFKGAEIGEYKIPAYAGNATAPADNILLATSAIQEGSLVEGAPSVWALGVRATDAKVGFMQVTEGTSIAKGNKAYIINNDITEYNEAAVAAFLLYNEETPAETTALDSVKVQVVDGNAPMYNLAGQRVGRDYRGIVIQNGKKFIK